MQEIITITTDAQGAKVVSARELHKFLEVKRDFSHWIKDRITRYGLVENQDFVRFVKNDETLGGRSIEYAITLDTAKELSMLQNNEKGREARWYFIECEKEMRAERNLPTLSQLDILVQSVNMLKKQEEEIKRLNDRAFKLAASLSSKISDVRTQAQKQELRLSTLEAKIKGVAKPPQKQTLQMLTPKELAKLNLWRENQREWAERKRLAK